jgi:DNA-binding NarL/FixJ family response regulator
MWTIEGPASPSTVVVAATSLDADDLRLLRLLSRGYDGRRLGRELGYSEATVRRRVHDLRLRLGARSTIHAVVIAVRAGVI